MKPALPFLVISGPQGAHKSAVTDHLAKLFSDRLVPITSIALSNSDKPVSKYPYLVAVTQEEFEIEEHTLITRDEIDGVKYGTTSEALLRVRQQGKIPVLRLRPQKALEFDRQHAGLVHIIELDTADEPHEPIMTFTFPGHGSNIHRVRVINGQMYEVERVVAHVLETIG